MSYIFELELIHFCSTSFDGFWATFPNISHLDSKPYYNSWKVLMIRVMHVIPVVENEKICKPMVDHFHLNEFEQNTYPSNTWGSSVYFREGLHIQFTPSSSENAYQVIVSCLRMIVHDMSWVLKSLVVLCWWCCNLGDFGKVNLSFARGRAKVKCGRIWWECKISYFSPLMFSLLYLFGA